MENGEKKMEKLKKGERKRKSGVRERLKKGEAGGFRERRESIRGKKLPPGEFTSRLPETFS